MPRRRPVLLAAALLMLVPLGIALFIRAHAPETAAAFQPTMSKVSTVALLLLMVMVARHCRPLRGMVVSRSWRGCWRRRPTSMLLLLVVSATRRCRPLRRVVTSRSWRGC